MNKTGILLSGGGARGAYQAGCLKAIAEILNARTCPFAVLSGISAGSINASYLAAHADRFEEHTNALCDIWSSIKTADVVQTSSFSLARIAMRWLFDLGFGGLKSGSAVKYLLDTAPLKSFLESRMRFECIGSNINSGVIDALCINATDYATNRNIAFVDQSCSFHNWKRVNRESKAATIGVDHIMASASIPLLFPPVRIEQAHYGDGALRNTAPLSSAIRLGAQKIVIIGVKSQHQDPPSQAILPTPARQLSCLINSALLDGIDMDIERMERINLLLSQFRLSERHEPKRY